MKLPYLANRLDDAVQRVYGEPYQTPDGATIISTTVSMRAVCAARSTH